MAPKKKSQSPTAEPVRGWKLWLFRLTAAIVAPALALVVLEAGLRLAGSGYRTAFLIPVEGRDGVFTTNPRFGWRFFPRHLARGPVPLEIAEPAPRQGRRLFRIFVVGGSAARGTPDSAYSFGRILEILLEASHGGDLRFAVHNAAMTAINSHVVLPIVTDCARHEPDLFVIYLGNNEVVGPYGAGTVFRPLSPSLAAIRGGIALRSTRLGQLLERGLAAANRGRTPRRWQGMEMFLERRLAADDPLLEQVYDHFARNLSAMVNVAAAAGARTLVATVATNLVDQPPFASLHRRDLDATGKARWQALYDAGTAAMANGRWQAAIDSLTAAAELDDAWAELHFHLGRARAALGHLDEARAELVRARDLDALRFRADSRINAILREVAAREAERGTLLADVDGAFAAGALPGRELFYEHVHLTLAGNYAVAREIWTVLAASDMLPPASAAPLPTLAQVAERLVLTPFDRHDLERDVLRIVARPPFTGQSGHQRDLERRRRSLAELRGRLTAELWETSAERYRRRLELDPDDLEIRRRFAVGLSARGRAPEAVAAWRFLVDRLPGVPAWRSSLALALADAGDVDGAVGELQKLLASWPETPEAHVNLGTVYEKDGRFQEAIVHYRRALELAPDDAPTSYNLGTALLRSGETTAAADHFRRLLAEHPDFAAAHHNLGYALEQLGDLDGAIASYRRAIAADPTAANAHNSLGLALVAAGRFDEAARAYLAALDAEPDFALAHFNLADLLLGAGRAETAVAHYRDGLRYRPDNFQARINLAIGLQLVGDHLAAAASLEEALALARSAGRDRLVEEIGRRLAAVRAAS